MGQIHSALLVLHRPSRLWGRELPPGTPDSAYGFAILVETGGGRERREGGEGGGSRWASRRGCDRVVVTFAVGRLRRFSWPSRAMWKRVNTPATQGVCPALISAVRPFPEAVAATRVPDQMIKQQSDWRVQCMAIDVPFCAFQGRCQRFQFWGRL